MGIFKKIIGTIENEFGIGLGSNRVRFLKSSSTANAAAVNVSGNLIPLYSLPVYAADSGSTDAYAITLDPSPGAYAAGLVVHFKASAANTGAATLNVNSLGAVTIKKNYSSDLADNDILAGQCVLVIYDGTFFQMLSPVANVNSGNSSGCALMGYLPSDFSTSSTSYVDITGMSVALEANSVYDIELILSGNSQNASGLHVGWSYPSGATINLLGYNDPPDSVDLPAWGSFLQTSEIEIALDAASKIWYGRFKGRVTTSSTSGNLKLQVKTFNSSYYAYIYSITQMTLIKRG